MLRHNIQDAALRHDIALLCTRVEQLVVHMPASADEAGQDLLANPGVPPSDSWACELFALGYNRALDSFDCGFTAYANDIQRTIRMPRTIVLAAVATANIQSSRSVACRGWLLSKLKQRTCSQHSKAKEAAGTHDVEHIGVRCSLTRGHIEERRQRLLAMKRGHNMRKGFWQCFCKYLGMRTCGE